MRGAERCGLAAALVVAACTGHAPVTDLRITVRFDSRLAIDQLRFSGTLNGAPLFPSTLRPDSPRGNLSDGQTVVVVVSDALADVVDVSAVGLRQGHAVAWGGASGVPVRGTEVPIEIHLGETPPGGDASIPLDGGVGDGDAGSAVLVVTTTTLLDATDGLPYGAPLVASGGSTPYQWTVVAGALPSGMALSPDGVIFGSPSSPGSSTFTVDVMSADGQSATQTLRLVVGKAGVQPLLLSTAALLDGMIGKPYSTRLGATGGTPPLAFSLAAGVLPNGLPLNSDGTLQGTPTTAGEAVFAIQVADAPGAFSQVATASLRLAIEPGAGALLMINTSVLPGARVGQPYSVRIAAVGGTLPYLFDSGGGSALPAGLTLSSDGTITGTPTAAGSYTFTMTARDGGQPAQVASRVLALRVASAAVGATLDLTANTLPGGVVGQAYQAWLTGTGGTAPYSFALVGGQLPQGLTLSSNGLIAGQPMTQGSFSVTMGVTDASMPQQAAARSYALVIASSPGALTVSTASLPAGTVGMAYVATLSASGGAGPYAWSLTAGALPGGVTLGPGGALSGTPTVSGRFSITFEARDANGATAARQLAMQVYPAQQSLALTTATLPDATAGVAYSAMLNAMGGTMPYGWSITSGQLPVGLSLNASTGAVSGVPSAAGSYPFVATVADSSGPAQFASSALSITVATNQLAITTTTLPSALVGRHYSTTLAATGGTPPYAWQLGAGSTLPAGLKLAAATGVLAGTPSVAGVTTFTVVVSDGAAQAAQRSLSLEVIAAGLQIVTNNLPAAVVTVPYHGALSASGGTPPYAWSIPVGTLPPGLSLMVDGSITGRASARGSWSFTAQATDAAQAQTTKPVAINVN